MVSKFLLFCFLISPIQPSEAFHSFYISICNISQNEDGLYVDYRFFRDDLEQALGVVQKGEPTPSSYCDQIASYIRKHFQIRILDEPIGLDLLHCEFAGEGQLETVTCKMKGLISVKNFPVIEIRSTVLLEEFEDQINMVRLRIFGSKKSFNLDSDRTSFSLPLQ